MSKVCCQYALIFLKSISCVIDKLHLLIFLQSHMLVEHSEERYERSQSSKMELSAKIANSF